jgi:hypothetical protein
MLRKQQRVLDSFRRVQGFLSAHPEVVPAPAGGQPSPLATQITALAGVIDRMTAFATQQETQRAQASLVAKDEKELRRELIVQHLRTIVQTARTLRGQVPGIGVLSAPAANIEAGPLVRFATAFARTAAMYEPVLVEHGQPADFLRQLEEVTTTLKRSFDARGEARGRRVGATKGIVEELLLGRRIVQAMDAGLKRILRNDSVLLAEWQQTKRVLKFAASSREPLSSMPTTPTPEIRAA